MSTRLFLLRHGPTAAPPGSFVGRTDVPLSGQGLGHLGKTAKQLQDTDSWYCSPMLRTRQTLEHVQKQGCSVGDPVYDDRLQEIDFGRWELQTFADIAAQDQELIAAWNQYLDFVFPEGEAVASFIARVESLLTLFREQEDKTLAVVTHGGVIRTMICLALGISPRNYLLFDVQHASLAVLELFSEGGILRGLNL
jgi:broad specificity phosphatase PhoE